MWNFIFWVHLLACTKHASSIRCVSAAYNHFQNFTHKSCLSDSFLCDVTRVLCVWSFQRRSLRRRGCRRRGSPRWWREHRATARRRLFSPRSRAHRPLWWRNGWITTHKHFVRGTDSPWDTCETSSPCTTPRWAQTGALNQGPDVQNVVSGSSNPSYFGAGFSKQNWIGSPWLFQISKSGLLVLYGAP